MKWRPAITMPRRFSKLILEIIDVRVERVQEITEEGAKAEGVPPITDRVSPNYRGKNPHHNQHRPSFMRIWNSLYGSAAWTRNEWVWAITFKRIS